MTSTHNGRDGQWSLKDHPSGPFPGFLATRMGTPWEYSWILMVSEMVTTGFPLGGEKKTGHSYGMHQPVFRITFRLHSVNLVHHLSPAPSHHQPLSSIPDLKHTCSTNPSHHRSSPTHWTVHWILTVLPSRTITAQRLVLVFRYPLLVDACVGLNSLPASFWSHGNKIIHWFISNEQIEWVPWSFCASSFRRRSLPIIGLYSRSSLRYRLWLQTH